MELKTIITRAGQKYLDEPIYRLMKPKAELVSPCAVAVAMVFGGSTPRPIYDVVGHERVRLRWRRP